MPNEMKSIYYVDAACWSDRHGNPEWVNSNHLVVEQQGQLVIILTDPSGSWEFGVQASELYLSIMNSMLSRDQSSTILETFSSFSLQASHRAWEILGAHRIADTRFDVVTAIVNPEYSQVCWAGGAVGLWHSRDRDSAAYISTPHLVGEAQVLAGIPRNVAYLRGSSLIRTRSAGCQPDANVESSLLEWSPKLSSLNIGDRIVLLSQSVWSATGITTGEYSTDLLKNGSAKDIATSAVERGAQCDAAVVIIGGK